MFVALCRTKDGFIQRVITNNSCSHIFMATLQMKVMIQVSLPYNVQRDKTENVGSIPFVIINNILVFSTFFLTLWWIFFPIWIRASHTPEKLIFHCPFCMWVKWGRARLDNLSFFAEEVPKAEEVKNGSYDLGFCTFPGCTLSSNLGPDAHHPCLQSHSLLVRR